jgi:hypothetical protein
MKINLLINKLITRFKSHTPEKWRNFGNKLVLITTCTSVPADLIFNKTIALVIFFIGVIGRCLVEFTTDNNDKST